MTTAVTERGQLTDRFSKAIEQLGAAGMDSVDLRLGGVYALEQIAKDSKDWYQPVVEVLAAFVRQHSSGLPPPEGETIDIQLITLMGLDDRYVPFRADIEAAVNVLSRRDRKNNAYVRADLQGADFRRISFPLDANFTDTDFSDAHMEFSRLMFADLRRCFFLSTQLQGAELERTDLRGAYLARANLYGADLKDADLKGADLHTVDLSKARNVTFDQLKVAKIDEDTTLPPDIDRAKLLKAMKQ